MKVHELKLWPGYLHGIRQNRKRCEIRKADRDFELGDLLVLREWDPKTETYSGYHVLARITSITPAQNNEATAGLVDGYVVLSIEHVLLTASWPEAPAPAGDQGETE